MYVPHVSTNRQVERLTEDRDLEDELTTIIGSGHGWGLREVLSSKDQPSKETLAESCKRSCRNGVEFSTCMLDLLAKKG
ncbi:hypothetical protein Trydic_g20587 [Trypoxylus dichotomus]